MVMPAVRSRRSIRKFLNKDVEKEKLDLIIEAALRAPSSMGRDPWEFIIVKDQNILTGLSKAKPHGSAFLKGANLGIVVCADKNKSDVWVEDTSIASTYVFLTAESLDLGACWIQIRNRNHSDNVTAAEYISDILGIPDNFEVLSIIAIGYPDEGKSPHKKEDLKYERIHVNGYGK
ncbi:nitroreductase family protein [Thermodesulfobacteriota bacterium]